ncbi:dimethylamine monooxygenase subunit DmmA family protein [Pseudarthrobacter sp. YAF2]|uniref:dimethylamine monooxygenase subunit DmmA family protein n=1 Tax=Pseudarthrobacter sp. YAF2 TaxID=3233078 RepID=UPI003F97626A
MKPAYVNPSAVAGPVHGFRGVICVSFGQAESLAPENPDGLPQQDLHFTSADHESLRQLRSVLASTYVGMRLVLAGPTADIQAAAAVAAECGLVEEEMRLLGKGAGISVVFCGHCHTKTPSLQGPGSEVHCQGCSTTLVISGHFSRRKAAYLGFAAHAEESA